VKLGVRRGKLKGIRLHPLRGSKSSPEVVHVINLLQEPQIKGGEIQNIFGLLCCK